MASNEPIEILVAQPHHVNGIINLVKSTVLLHEPLSVALGSTWEDSAQWMEEFIDVVTQQSASHVAININNEVIGFRLSKVLDMEKLAPGDSLCDFLPLGHYRNICDTLMKNWPKVLPRTGKVWYFVGLCVQQDYGDRGIARQMTEENLKLGKELGCSMAAVVASNWMSQRVFEKTGFRVVETLYYANYKDENGRSILFMKDPRQDSIRFYVKDL